MEAVMVEAKCIKSTAADIDYFEADRTYTLDLEWAKRRGIWKYFEEVRQVLTKEAYERIREDERSREAIHDEQMRENEESEAKLKESAAKQRKITVPKEKANAKPTPGRSYPGPKGRTSAAKD